MDKKKGILNVTVSIAFKILILVGAILVRRFLIKYIGNEVNGLNSLYTSIIGFLAVAELGVGSAITFCMYKPIVEGNTDKVSALYHLFTKLYLIIGGIILVAGCALIPLLPYLAADYQNVNQNVYLTFFLMLVSVVISYLFSSKTSLINAYKNNYVTTTISSTGMLLQYALQITVLVLTQSFVWYLLCAIAVALLQWGATELVTRRKYNAIIKNKQSIDAETKKEVTKNVKAMFMHKVGSVLVNTADSVIISAFIGVVILGKYSNYTTIMVAMTGVLGLFFTPLTSVIGHMCVENDTEEIKKYLNFFHAFNFIIGVVFFLGYYAVIDNLVNICFKSNEPLELDKSISFIITLNYFIQFMRQSILLFKDATGTFYNDRWKPLFEGLLNVGLSIGFIYLFSYCFGEDFAVVGVIVATIITNLTICHIVEPHVLYKYGLKIKTKEYYIRNYLYMVVFAALLVALHFCLQSYDNEWIELLVNGCIAVAISVLPCVAVVLLNKDFRHYFKNLFDRIKHKFGKKVADTATPENVEEDLTVYNAVTVTVTGKTPINGFNASEQWLYANLVDADKAIIADNNLFTASAKSFEKNTDGSLYQPTSGVTAFGAHGKNVVSLGNIATDANNKDNALTITINCALTSLNVKVLVADSAGTKIRTGIGNLHIEVNGVQVATNAGADLIWGNGANDKLTDLKMGDIVTIWAEKPNSGGRFYIAEINAEADTSKIEKTVNVMWGTNSQSYHYFAEITAPEDPKTGNGEFIGWYEKTTGEKFEDGKLAEGNYEFEARYEYTVHITYNDGTEDVDLYLNIVNEDAEKANLILAELPTFPAQGNQVHSGWELNGVVVDFATLVLGNNKSDAPNYTLTPHYETSTAVLVTEITVTAAGDVKEVKAGGTLQLTATPNADADNKEVTWSSSDEDIATVDAIGKVTGVKQGSVTITATAKDGSGVTGEIVLTVSKPDNKTGSLTLAVINASTSISDPDSVITLSTTKTYKIKDFGSNKVSDGQGKEFANALIGNSDGAWDCKITSTKAAAVKIYLSCAENSNVRNTCDGATISASGSSHMYENITTTGTTYNSSTKVNTLTPYSFTLYLEANETVTITSSAGRFAILAVEYDYVP